MVIAICVWLAALVQGPSSPHGTPEVKTPPVVAGHAVAPREALPRALAAAGWNGLWNPQTRQVTRLWGRSSPVAGTTQDPARAAQVAREFWRQHVSDVVAGAHIDDFSVVSNVLTDGVRIVGFAQHHGGVRVEGGQLSVRIVADRIVLAAANAWPNVAPSGVAMRWPSPAVLHRSIVNVRAALNRADVRFATPVPTIVPQPIGSGVGFIHAQRFAIAAGDERWTAFTDGQGRVVGLHNEIMHATGRIDGNAFARWPGGERVARPLVHANVTVNNAPTQTDAAGQVTWPSGTAAITVAPTGPRVTLTNTLGPLAAPTFVLADGASATWTPDTELDDAQLQAFVHAEVAQAYAQRLLPALPFVFEPVEVTVNIDDQCNAFSNGIGIFFFRSSAECENTARLADVVYHEYGHSVHRNALIEGVGAYDGALGEGMADYFAVSITGDPQMGPGFFYTANPLRDLDPADTEASWPDDISGIHTTGKIIGGALWDLRKDLIVEIGSDAALALMDRMLVAIWQRATDIPSTLLEALVVDDNDGDLTNGTPHECVIRAAFGRHGLRSVSGRMELPGAVAPAPDQTQFAAQVYVTGQSAACAGDEIERVEVSWRPGFGSEPVPGQVEASLSGNAYAAAIPLPPPGGKLRVQARIIFADGTSQTLPNNRADPVYEVVVGDFVPLYCADFDAGDPFAAGWRQNYRNGAGFEWGPATSGAGLDPDRAYTGTNVIGLGLNNIYYDDQTATLSLPEIDAGVYTDVRLQYRRWLTVEDGYFDQANIRLGDAVAWSNLNSNQGDSSSTHHIDREWRFHDVALSPWATNQTLAVHFDLTSDQGLHFGGWTLDDVCLVANPLSQCGDGTKTPTEACDDGAANAWAPDACRPTCRRATCGDGVTDSGECDADSLCEADCRLDVGGGGCRSARGVGSLAWAGALAWLLLARRRSARATPPN